MRYDDWDILVFPTQLDASPDDGQEAKVPVKEFKVACHVVPDMEASQRGLHSGLPIMACFIPSLPAGSPFHVSIHNWRTPDISQYTKNYSKHWELAKFEARIFIDGRVAASTTFGRTGTWPCLVANTFEFNKSGELEPFRFPHFRQELLYHNHWHPGDDIGRIKVVISEGFPRDSLTNPIERVKNVVAFSFQHAPLDILENNGIAWPNPQMWKRSSFVDARPVPAYRSEEGAESHGHSPRRQSVQRSGKTVTAPPSLPVTASAPVAMQPAGLLGNPMLGQPFPVLAQGAPLANGGMVCPDPFSDTTAYMGLYSGLGGNSWNPDPSAAWAMSARQMSKHSSTDASMPDYVSSASGHVNLDVFQMQGAMMEDDLASSHLKVPTNTPTAGVVGDNSVGTAPAFSFNIPNSVIPSDLAATLTHSLLNQPHPLPVQPHMIPLPASEIKSRKENRGISIAGTEASASPCFDHVDRRNFSQSAFGFTSATPSHMQPTQHQIQQIQVRALSRVTSDSSSDRPAFSTGGSRAASAGEFGASLTNMTESSIQQAPMAGVTATASTSSVATLTQNIGNSDKGTKRSRTFTATSTKAIDDEDEPRRVSPRLRSAAFAGDGRSEN
ncbi:hypothetical protein GGTG_10570 [Gaeumannomyces tritici R3-111a-1]|uniref:Uncharacterized protein n=1 Tax=Gaeumannomyces tritici (strain R3-111a-1) TaxID=644352 RepID=J3PAP5_GAET3|nr:hypothetical protein GGTG_10570 [Gaeumannomyces tritici R3-111a-1]EJT71311.1 hypothetical protein GGTG_10570 [Gaeumannomyces tritici R3-111a-1]